MPFPRLRLSVKVAAPVFLALAAMSQYANSSEPVTVLVENRSFPNTCAEEDNITYIFKADNGMRSFKVSAALPSYLPQIVQDIRQVDFANCPHTPPPPPVTVYTPPDMILYQDEEIMLEGQVDPRFWRPHKASVRVDQLEWPFLDIVRLLKKTPSGPVQVLVFYPQDGYWRLKGLPPRRFANTSFGSSFLLGPVEAIDKRPYVEYKRITFDWNTLSFTVETVKGGKIIVQLTALGDESTSEVTVTFDPPLPKGTIFSSIRSMYVGPGNHDTEHVTTRTAPDAEPVRTPVMAFKSGQVNDILFSRTELSRHNVSAPDIRYFNFAK
ncbi:MAG: hypothetical protein U1E83_01405 [Methylotetracoccus sp.]